MKTSAKTIEKLLIVMLFIAFGMGNIKAQTHVKSAQNCLLHDAYLKELSTSKNKTKNSVSCIDCYCKICGDKKQKEKEAKQKAEELAKKQKTTTPQKKTTATTAKKAKSDEAILVAPKPKVSNSVVAETKKIEEPKKEIKTISKKIKTVEKEKIEMLLNEISKLYVKNKDFKSNRDFTKFDFSGTKITIKSIVGGGSYDYVYIYSFDLKDVKYLTFDKVVAVKAENGDYESGHWDEFKKEGRDIVKGDWDNAKISITKSADTTYTTNIKSYEEEGKKVFELLKQAALEAGATFQEEVNE